MKNTIAVVILVTAFLCWGASEPGAPTVGRYQLYQPPSLPGDKYMLDTTSGKTWVIRAFPDGYKFWEPMDKVNTDAEELSLGKTHQNPAKE